MIRFFVNILTGIVCLLTGVAIGVWYGPQLKTTEPAQEISSLAAKVPLLKSMTNSEENDAIESYEYPTIKFKPKPLSEAQGALVQLSTRFEKADQANQQGKMHYRLTLFKAPEKQQCEVQLLDDADFKLSQFDASDFHQIPGSADIREARDSFPLTEEEYKKVKDYSIK